MSSSAEDRGRGGAKDLQVSSSAEDRGRGRAKDLQVSLVAFNRLGGFNSAF